MKVQIFSASCPFITVQVFAMISTIIYNWWKAIAVMVNAYLGQTGSIDGLTGRSQKVGNLTSTSHGYECPDSLFCCLTDATIPGVHYNTFTGRIMTFKVVLTY